MSVRITLRYGRITSLLLKLSLTVVGCALVPPSQELVLGPDLETILSDTQTSQPAPTWKLVYSQEVEGEYHVRDFVPVSESADSWRTLFRLERSVKGPKSLSAEEQMDLQAFEWSERCPGIAWNVLEKFEDGVLYEWDVQGCLFEVNQHQITRIVDGERARWQISVTRKGNSMPETVRRRWINWLSDQVAVQKL